MMTQYHCSDIIKMALSLADLTNSSFITYGDNYKFLNDSYMKLYQKMIDAGDKYFLKTFTLDGSIAGSNFASTYDLPDDFYQLYSIQIVPTCVPILRKSKNEPKNSQRYDIINNKLVIYGNISDNLEVTYFPKPKTISYKVDQFSIDLDTANIIKSCYDKYAFVYNSTTSVINITNLETGDIVSLPTTFSATDGVLGEHILLSLGNGNSSVTQYNRISKEVTTITENGYNLYTYRINKDPTLFAYNTTSNEYSIFTYIGSTLYQGALDINTAGLTITGGISDGVTAIVNASDGTYFVNSSTSTKLTDELMNIKFSIVSDGIYYFYTTKNNLYSYDGIYLSKIENNIYSLGGINKVSVDTGYGYIDEKLDGYYENCIFPDTMLDYPSNSLYTLLAYYLSILYCTKQGKDTTLLEAAAYKQETQYFDMINNDVNLNYRITNIGVTVGI